MRTILHADLNSCYASVECAVHPEYRGVPLAVGGEKELRHGIILAKNEEAKKMGVKTGEAIWQASFISSTTRILSGFSENFSMISVRG